MHRRRGGVQRALQAVLAGREDERSDAAAYICPDLLGAGVVPLDVCLQRSHQMLHGAGELPIVLQQVLQLPHARAAWGVASAGREEDPGWDGMGLGPKRRREGGGRGKARACFNLSRVGDD